jgi:hypothetical protein
MKFKSQIATQVSGSVGGTTYSHNRGGLYMRARAIPTDPGTERQNVMRTFLGLLSNAWLTELTATQRNAWNLYAANVPLLDVFGDPVFVSGQNHFIRSNSTRLQGGGNATFDAPVIFTLGLFTAPSITVDVSSGTSLGFTTTDEWANEPGAGLMIYMGKPQNQSISFFKGPWRLLTTIDGDSSPPTSPQILTAAQVAAGAFAYAADQRIWFRSQVFRHDGRLSYAAITGPELVTA